MYYLSIELIALVSLPCIIIPITIMYHAYANPKTKIFHTKCRMPTNIKMILLWNEVFYTFCTNATHMPRLLLVVCAMTLNSIIFKQHGILFCQKQHPFSNTTSIPTIFVLKLVPRPTQLSFNKYYILVTRFIGCKPGSTKRRSNHITG